MNSTALPKKIWFLWFQGKAEMPEIIKMCFESWVRHNHAWEVLFLSRENLAGFIDLEAKTQLNLDEIPLQAQTDIIRINLLKKHGGVWVDATCYCNTPLDNWLDNSTKSGFFAFSKPHEDRMISSWFLAAKPNNVLVDIYCKATNEFWQKNRPKKLVKYRGEHKALDAFLLKTYFKKPTRWLSTFTVKLLNRTHYFWFHFLFEKIYKSNPACQKIWDETPNISAKIPMQLMLYGLNTSANSQIKNEIDKPKAPLYKLSWEIIRDNEVKDSPLMLLKQRHSLKN